MAEQWIPAAQAMELVRTSTSGFSERMALCDRAFAGLIKTRARLLMIDDAKRENVVIPSRFWWAKGHEALDQEWTVGDFSTWIESREQWRAYGVSFALSGLLDMLPVERRAATARNLSVVGNMDWFNAKEARRFAYDKAGLAAQYAGAAIIDAGMLGYVTARTVLMRRTDGNDSLVAEEREWDIPEWFWENFTTVRSSKQDWERGVFSGEGIAPNGLCWITLTGVYFLAETLDVLLPRDAKVGLADKPGPNPGGRPRKEFWDDLWCAVWGQIFRAELIPQRQADIERAMLEWAAVKNHDVSESTIKPLARKMLAEIRSEGRNPTG